MSAGRGWLARAACREVDPELFFPAATTGPVHAEQVAVAKAVCAGCPVQAECLELALDALSDGIAGGFDEDERRALRRSTPRRAQAVTREEPAAQARHGRAVGQSVAALAVEFGVSVRTVERWTRTGVA